MKDPVKKDIAEKYNTAASGNGFNKAWLKEGNSARHPESKSAYYFIDRKIEEALKYSSRDSCLRVLEIGCRFGNMTYGLSQVFDKTIAVDISSESIDKAQKRFNYYNITNVEFKTDDAEILETINDNSLDVVFSFSTIRYCPDIPKALKAIYDKLDTNGKVIIDFPNRLSPWHFIIKPLLRIKKHIHDTLFTEKEIIELFKAAGYKNIEWKYILFTTRRLPTLFLPIFKIIDRIFELLPLINRLAGIIMIKGEKYD